jgi:hypothetical protein
MRFCIAVLAALALSLPAQAQQKDAKDAAHIKQDVLAHRTIAAAHEAAAKCLEAGKPEKDCQAQLAKDCKNLAIGKHCGMRHRH